MRKHGFSFGGLGRMRPQNRRRCTSFALVAAVCQAKDIMTRAYPKHFLHDASGWISHGARELMMRITNRKSKAKHGILLVAAVISYLAPLIAS